MGQCITQFIRSFVVFCALVFLTGCPCGNGWPYGADSGGCKSNSDIAGQAPSYTGIGTLSYYWLDPDYTCVPNGSSTAISSYRGKIQFEDGGYTLFGDKCSQMNGDAGVSLASSDVDTSWMGWKLVGYEEGIYTAEQTVIGAWCEDMGRNYEILVSYPDGTSQRPLLTVGQSYSVSYDSATRMLSAFSVRYLNSSYRLDISLSPSSVYSDKYDGILRPSGGAAVSVLCRVTKP